LLALLGGGGAGRGMAGMIWGTMAASGEMNGGHASREAGSGVAAIAVPVLVVFSLLTAAFAMFFAFIYLTVWEHPHSGWAAVKASMRLVWSHFWSVLGLFILFGLIFTMVMLAWGLVAFFLTLVSPILALLANLAGLVALFFMMPVFLAWQASAVTYLYHSWTGQLLDQSPAPDTGTPALPTGMFPPPPLPGQGG